MARRPAPISTLSDLLSRIGPVLSAAGDMTPIMIGKGYLEHGVGAGPRVVFVPAPKGRWGAPSKIGAGHLAAVTVDCLMLVRGAESGDEATRLSAAEELADRTVNVIRHLAPGRTQGSEWADDSPLPVDAYGADIALAFSFTRQIADDPKIREAIASSLTPVSPEDTMRPNGATNDTFDVSVTTERV